MAELSFQEHHEHVHPEQPTFWSLNPQNPTVQKETAKMPIIPKISPVRIWRIQKPLKRTVRTHTTKSLTKVKEENRFNYDIIRSDIRYFLLDSATCLPLLCTLSIITACIQIVHQNEYLQNFLKKAAF